MATMHPQIPFGHRPDIIKAEAFCSICGERFDFTNLQILEEQDGTTLLYIKCGRCQAGSLSSISFGQGRLQFLTAVTDLSQDEVLDFRNEASIDEDDVLRLHAHMEVDDNFLNQFNV
ncbi:MAG: hypothetical protein A2898_02610 [Candidatus Kerfeldbacteria bacterium RIFCSPLOWO2_01_FULL_48_11]|uniref:Uncharacterized protein n=1 Tax=Candidatus Kerfeldbacteria bacterium RIFCSPLOWO2_01_FULL_48_11 TaxID=1798543 RepID=A0A1G2B1T8_9BACT|nr:MAG: hypothetical protein UY52_C0022G0006 [Parcubacteria group bacterium GW2011_GWC2_49_9]OGY83142.1 MAG: hypothetical protein A2898_02610 [Candidatus Kerfeldbacteria bacterium RIFCSPLOWO2_01_FULL_48_11]HCJ52816.1 hypothetical protein [Candidatus Kerfeldbacteria bacterium]